MHPLCAHICFGDAGGILIWIAQADSPAPPGCECGATGVGSKAGTLRVQTKGSVVGGYKRGAVEARELRLLQSSSPLTSRGSSSRALRQLGEFIFVLSGCVGDASCPPFKVLLYSTVHTDVVHVAVYP